MTITQDEECSDNYNRLAVGERKVEEVHREIQNERVFLTT